MFLVNSQNLILPSSLIKLYKVVVLIYIYTYTSSLYINCVLKKLNLLKSSKEYNLTFMYVSCDGVFYINVSNTKII